MKYLILLFTVSFNLYANYSNTSTWQNKSPWKEIQKNIDEQKYEKAFSLAQETFKKYEGSKNTEYWTRSLIMLTNLRSGLHGKETAVRLFKKAKWPKELKANTILNLYFAKSLMDYYQQYSWEINTREEIESKQKVDLKKWTKGQILREINSTFVKVYKNRSRLKKVESSSLLEFVKSNNYPRKINKTMYEASVYLWLGHLKNTALWSPVHLNEKWRLKVNDLLKGDTRLQVKDLTSSQVSPIQKVSFLLSELEKDRLENRYKESAMNAYFEKWDFLKVHYSSEPELALLKKSLNSYLQSYRDFPWWAVGSEKIAKMIKEENTEDSFIRARSLCLKIMKKFTSGIGYRRCNSMIAEIENPDLNISSMKTDALKKRSIKISYRNIEKIYFRAYKFDIKSYLLRQKDYSLLPSYKTMRSALNRAPEYQWEQELSKTEDYKPHVVYGVPKIKKNGFYLLYVSNSENFDESNGSKIIGTYINISDIVLVSTPLNGKLHVKAVSGKNGKALRNVLIELMKRDYKTGHDVSQNKKTNKSGEVVFSQKSSNHNYGFFLMARKSGDLGLDLSNYNLYKSSSPSNTSSELLYTDRSIYRPNQTIYWKAIAYSGSSLKGSFKVRKNTTIHTYLYDSNNKVVESKSLKSNKYGSVSGEFKIPSGKALGRWRVSTNHSSQYIKVEEYKRPTFFVDLLDNKKELRLNEKAKLKGKASYYFGSPLSKAKVRWKLSKRASPPWWWSYWGRYYGHYGISTSSQIVDQGQTTVDQKGDFTISFNPEAKEYSKLPELLKSTSYTYTLNVDVLDEGGETRSSSKSFNIGYVGVKGSFSNLFQTYKDKQIPEVKVLRTNLSGKAQKGQGEVNVFSLKSPAKVGMISDYSLVPESIRKQKKYSKSGDFLEERSSRQYNVQRIIETWETHKLLKTQELKHDKNGQAQIEMPKLKKGVYRLVYSTKDERGREFKVSKSFIVAGVKPSLPFLSHINKQSFSIGDTAVINFYSGLKDQQIYVKMYQANKFVKNLELKNGKIEIPIKKRHLGGFSLQAVLAYDHQLIYETKHIYVPWVHKNLKMSFTRLRDKISPGQKETISLKIKAINEKGNELAMKKSAEVLAYMYDKSLDVFTPHLFPSPQALYSSKLSYPALNTSLGVAQNLYNKENSWRTYRSYPSLYHSSLYFYSSYGIGGMGRRKGMLVGKGRMADGYAGLASKVSADQAPRSRVAKIKKKVSEKKENQMAYEEVLAKQDRRENERSDNDSSTQTKELRSNFSETAFFKPHLISDKNGEVQIDFTVPDSVTEWKVYAHALTDDLRSTLQIGATKSVKDLMLRPYLPRFLREGDRAQIKLVLNNTSKQDYSGNIKIEITDSKTEKVLNKSFKAKKNIAFKVDAGGSSNYVLELQVPNKVGEIKIKVLAEAEEIADGELRSLPILPSRIHLVQSRFVAVKKKKERVINFEDMKKNSDKSLIHESLITTVDAQLMYGVLDAMPYLINYPYECTEQTLNRFLSTAILQSTFKSFPDIAKMAKKLSARKKQYEVWSKEDPNRKIKLEETPWLTMSEGGAAKESELLKVLDPQISKAQKEKSLQKLFDSQTSIGAFPWFPGGRPSPYMTLYVLHGFAKAQEFGVALPKPQLKQAWAFMKTHYKSHVLTCVRNDTCWEFVTYINYVLSMYKDKTVFQDAFSQAEQKEMLAYSFKHWKKHAPLLKGMLALTLKRHDRSSDANLVFDSVMDSAKTTQDEGTFWSPEDQAWLWYNDTIESHAFALRVLSELRPKAKEREGLVQWLFLNKKLNHWKSTKATAEVVYSLLHYLKQEDLLGKKEAIAIKVGNQTTEFNFSPDEYSGKNNQVVIKGDKIDPKTMSKIVVTPKTQGFMFVSSTWHYSTEKLPDESRGDLFKIKRKYFIRHTKNNKTMLRPLKKGDFVKIGDELEVQISINTRFQSEYVQLKDPRPANTEPVDFTSKHKWEFGIAWFEEIRDSGTNFFFENLPKGQYDFKYRLRVNMAGTFRVGPATLQSMYAPEFNAFSSGRVIHGK